jgi:hypothetical protein
MNVESAITAATVKATVVKKPKTFCTRTRAECILGGDSIVVVGKNGRNTAEVSGELANTSPELPQPYGGLGTVSPEVALKSALPLTVIFWSIGTYVYTSR